MALVPAQITVNFTANYNGPHRICYRIVGAPSYTCTVPGTPAGNPGIHPNCGLGPCFYNIPIDVDNETCDVIQYEGYAQPACEDETSEVGRIPFTISFTPSPACKKYTVTCDNSVVNAVTINDGGTGYTDGVYNALPIIGAGGSGATANVTVTGGVITGIVMVTSGSGYTGIPILDISTIPYLAGTPAVTTVDLSGCKELTLYDCNGVTVNVIPAGALQPGDALEMCNGSEVAPNVPTDFTIAASGNCLCDCIEVNVQNTTGDTVDYSYITCNGSVVTGTLAGVSETGNVCIVNGSLYTKENGAGSVNIVTTGPCEIPPAA